MDITKKSNLIIANNNISIDKLFILCKNGAVQHKKVIKMITKEKIQAAQEQFINIAKNPQDFLAILNEKNQAFAKELQELVSTLPQEALEQQKKAQENLVALGQKVQSSMTQNPVNWTEVQQSLLKYQTESFATQSKIAQEQAKKIQKLFSVYDYSQK